MRWAEVLCVVIAPEGYPITQHEWDHLARTSGQSFTLKSSRTTLKTVVRAKIKIWSRASRNSTATFLSGRIVRQSVAASSGDDARNPRNPIVASFGQYVLHEPDQADFGNLCAMSYEGTSSYERPQQRA